MKIISFNINGIRAHYHQLFNIIDLHKPDLISLQEIKVNDICFPLEKFMHLDYKIYFYGQKSYHGVAFFSKKKLFNIRKGFPDEDNKFLNKRIIIGEMFTNIGLITLINIYSPQGDSRNNKFKFLEKKDFFNKLIKYIKRFFSNKDNIIIMGDLNICISDSDIGIGEISKKKWLNSGKCSFLPEERDWIDNLMCFGFFDVFREKNKDILNRFSWFDYRSNSFKKNIGLRIDVILVSQSVYSYCTEVGIDYKIRNMIRPSDHAPIWSVFDFF